VQLRLEQAVKEAAVKAADSAVRQAAETKARAGEGLRRLSDDAQKFSAETESAAIAKATAAEVATASSERQLYQDGKNCDPLATSAAEQSCRRPGCDKPGTMPCPLCQQANLPTFVTCSQQHFDELWDEHGLMHESSDEEQPVQALLPLPALPIPPLPSPPLPSHEPIPPLPSPSLPSHESIAAISAGEASSQASAVSPDKQSEPQLVAQSSAAQVHINYMVSGSGSY
jgi:hypothetical protein